jgi:cyanate permease
MSKEMMAVIGFGVIGAVALVMLVIERRAVAARKAARGGREVDLSGIFDGSDDPSGRNG